MDYTPHNIDFQSLSEQKYIQKLYTASHRNSNNLGENATYNRVQKCIGWQFTCSLRCVTLRAMK